MTSLFYFKFPFSLVVWKTEMTEIIYLHNENQIEVFLACFDLVHNRFGSVLFPFVVQFGFWIPNSIILVWKRNIVCLPLAALVLWFWPIAETDLKTFL